MSKLLVDLDIYLLVETEEAYGVSYGDNEPLVWVPKSQCEIEKKKGSKSVVLTMPEALAQEKELI